MAVQTQYYSTDGTTKVFPQTKYIPSKTYCVVYATNITGESELISSSLYDIINNAIVFEEVLDTTTYSDFEIRVADTEEELGDSASDLAIVASIYDSVVTVAGIEDEVVTVAGIEAEIQSLYADKVTLDSLYADKTTLDSLYADKTTLDSLYADKATLDSLYADKATLDSLFADKVTLDSLYADKATLDSLYADKATLDSLFADKVGLDAIYANLTEILQADDNATIATDKALEASVSASNAESSREEMLYIISASATDPITRDDGNALQAGDYYYNTADEVRKIYNGTQWNVLVGETALSTSYDNSDSGLDATNVKEAIDESLHQSKVSQTKIGSLTIGQDLTPDSITYSGTTATVTISSGHNLNDSDTVYISGITSTVSDDEDYLNGTFTITYVNDTEFTYTASGTPTGTLTVTSASIRSGDLDVKGEIFIDSTNIKEGLIGLNQTWQDVSSDRSESTNFTNSTGYPITILIETNANNGERYIYLY